MTFAFSAVVFLVPQLISVLCLESSAFFPSAIQHDVCRLVFTPFPPEDFDKFRFDVVTLIQLYRSLQCMKEDVI